MNKLSWENVSLQIKILFLKDLMLNSEDGNFDNSDIHIVDALITGSVNIQSGDMGFNFEKHHMLYMKSAWELSIKSQKDDSVTEPIKYYLANRKK